MKPRERVLAIVNRQPVDRIPVDLWYTHEIGKMLMSHYGVSDNLSLHKAMGIDKIEWIGLGYTGAMRPVESEDQSSNHWGCVHQRVQAGVAEYGERLIAPLQGYDTIESLNDYPWWPDPAQFDYANGVEQAKRASQEFATIGPWVSFFEIYCGMRGLEQALMDVIMDPDYVNAVLDRIESIQTDMLHRFYKQTGGLIDFAFISDDMGAQSGMLMSMDCWEQLLHPRLTRWCKLAHDYGMKVLFHTDGSVGPLVPRLIDAGIDVLNPVQHVCPDMDCEGLKTQYGDRLMFHGGIENQSILPFGTAEQVRDEVRHCLSTLGRGGGYICCSCHNIQAGTPLENILALVDTVKAEGHLPLEKAAV